MLNSVAARIVEPLRWLIVAGIAYTLATTTLFFLASPEFEPSNAATAPQARTPDQSAAVSINAILSRNLFGTASANDAAPTTTETAVTTRLPLELRGVFMADVPEDSAAIVAQKGKSGELYSIGSVLPGNAELIEVQADHIVLRRAGARERLNFPEFASSGGVLSNTRSFEPPPDGEDLIDEAPIDAAPWPPPDEPPPEAEQASVRQDTPRELVDEYRQMLAEDPEGALANMGIAPVNPGSASGYRLDSVTAQSPYLSQTGLQPGDVVLSVNGQAVGDIQRDQQQIDNVLSQGSARLEVQRGSRRFFVTASLNQ